MTVQFNKKTKSRGIEWCDETRNVFGGCFHRCRWAMPDGTIAMCYAEELAERGVAKRGYPQGFEHHYYRPHNLKALVRGTKPKLIFCDSMSDMFGHWVEEDNLIEVLNLMGGAGQHVYQSLTKAPARIAKFVEHLPWNLWVGISSPPDYFMPAQKPVADFDGTNIKPATPMPLHAKQKMLRRSLQILERVRQATGNVTWMSVEPASWDMTPIFVEEYERTGFLLDWVVIGAAANNGKYFQPDPAIVGPMIEFFAGHGVPIFYKGNIRPTIEANHFGRWREDFPTRHPGTRWPFPAVVQRQTNAIEYGWPLNERMTDDLMDAGANSTAQMALL